MVKQSTIDKWKPIIDGYDPKKERLYQYCIDHNISQKSFERNRILIYGFKEKPSDAFAPVTVVSNNSTTSIDFYINDISVRIDSSVDDVALKRIIKICSEL